MINRFASKESGLIKSERQLLIEAEQKIGQMENERRELIQKLEMITMVSARRQVAIIALGKHYTLSPEAMKEIVDAYITQEETEFMSLNEDLKKKFLDEMKAGKVPEFTTVPNPDKKEE